jgi:hypothetical protein
MCIKVINVFKNVLIIWQLYNKPTPNTIFRMLPKIIAFTTTSFITWDLNE